MPQEGNLEQSTHLYLTSLQSQTSDPDSTHNLDFIISLGPMYFLKY